MKAITKKKSKMMHFQFNWTFYGFNYKVKHVKKSASAKRLYKFFILNKQLLKHIFGDLRDHQFSKIHKAGFKKDRKRLYFQSFFLTLARKCTTILFQSFIIPKIKLMKQLVLHRKVFINGLLNIGYLNLYNPLDIVHVSFNSGDLNSRFIKGLPPELLIDKTAKTVLMRIHSNSKISLGQLTNEVSEAIKFRFVQIRNNSYTKWFFKAFLNQYAATLVALSWGFKLMYIRVFKKLTDLKDNIKSLKKFVQVCRKINWVSAVIFKDDLTKSIKKKNYFYSSLYFYLALSRNGGK